MWRSTIVVGISILVMSSAAAEAKADKRPAGPPPARILNQVIDLLDNDVVLQMEAGERTWESAIFDTSQYNDILLRASTEVERGVIVCNLAWRFSRDQEFLVPGYEINRIPSPGDDGTFVPLTPPTGPVQGLQARVICEINPPPGGDPGPEPVVGTVSDVQVLLRRY
jgi:hypothetical protein